MAILSFSSSSSTSLVNEFPNSKICCQNYPLASKIIVKTINMRNVGARICAEFEMGEKAIEISGNITYYSDVRELFLDLPFSTSESRLVQEFSKYGEIAEVRLVTDEARQKSKGFAFIQYTSQDAALLALESMDYQMFEERRVFVELAKPRNYDFGGNIKTSGPPQEQNMESKEGVDE